MSDELTILEGDEDDSPVIKQLRQALKASNAEVKAREDRIAALEQQTTASVLKEAGFDPDSKAAVGLLKLHADEGRELTVEAIRETATTYSIAVPGVTTTPISDVAAQALHQTDTANQLAGVSTVTAPPPDLDQRIAEASAAGNVAEALALKAQRAELSG